LNVGAGNPAPLAQLIPGSGAKVESGRHPRALLKLV
jgi:hypothetical protein